MNVDDQSGKSGDEKEKRMNQGKLEIPIRGGSRPTNCGEDNGNGIVPRLRCESRRYKASPSVTLDYRRLMDAF
jgi:hypothetical protein